MKWWVKATALVALHSMLAKCAFSGLQADLRLSISTFQIEALRISLEIGRLSIAKSFALTETVQHRPQKRIKQSLMESHVKGEAGHYVQDMET